MGVFVSLLFHMDKLDKKVNIDRYVNKKVRLVVNGYA